MNILDIAMLVFIFLETLNVIVLYFTPNSKRGNGVAMFDEWEKSKEDENSHLFARYMTYWVAGTKLIFILLVLVIVISGNEILKVHTVVALILSIATYFWKLHPIIKKLDKRGQITPKGYSKMLGITISSFIIMFSGALVAYVIW